MGGGCALEEHMIRRCSYKGHVKQVDEKSESTNPEQITAGKKLRMFVCRWLAISGGEHTGRGAWFSKGSVRDVSSHTGLQGSEAMGVLGFWWSMRRAENIAP